MPLARFVDGQVAEGRYVSASEVGRVELRLLTEREAARAGAAGAAAQDGRTPG